jgi:glutamate-1-semialdehyde 2,1-aminomutase
VSRSAELFARARRVTPGGVHSPVRSFHSVGGTPVFVDHASAAQLVDVDGRRFIDFCMAFGPLILGHRNEAVEAAVQSAVARGWSYGTAETTSLELAELITERVPWVEQLRFVNSGTEAVMSCLRLARAATGRNKILKFDGCYHGHTDSMLIKAGSGLAGQAVADSAGVPAHAAGDTLIANLDDEPSVDRVFDAHGASIAAAIIEPLPANYGLLPQRPAFLQHLARSCRKHGALLIFDEVITGFRVAFGGYAERYGIAPDLVTYGKIIGGGFPVGAFGGSRELMEQVAPIGPVYQAGTLSANPVSMNAGLATLKQLADGTIYTRLAALGETLESGIRSITGIRQQRIESIFWLLPSTAKDDEIARSPQHIPVSVGEQYPKIFHRLLAKGVYLPPSAYEVGFLSAAHSAADIAILLDAIESAVADK